MLLSYLEPKEAMTDRKEYTIGWISAIPLEYVAAQIFLDKDNGKPSWVHPKDQNHYILGTIGQHNVAMTVLSAGQHGVVSVTLAATHMGLTFPNLRMCLMVGIGGGVPSEKHDIRLGDVVVSFPTFHKQHGSLGGVVQYDYGKTIREKRFQSARYMNEPPRALLNAVAGLQAKYEIRGNRIDANVVTMLEKYPRLRGEYSRPDPGTDRLYSFVKGATCDNTPNSAEGCEASTLFANRPPRTESQDKPTIHYGLIASADSFMEDAEVRDMLSKELDVLCFEMEAAGLMNDFPCLVIRGICDYADEFSAKEWQGYAAMTASAYAKDLLYEVMATEVKAEKKISDILSVTDIHKVAEEQRDISKAQLQAQKDFAKERLSEKEQECLQLFRLTDGSSGATYEWYKDRVEDRVEGTCLWLLQHKHFKDWLNQDSGSLLVTADPGCGKSVLAKYLIDCGLPRSSTICYFFFKDQDQNTIRKALCALVHQLLSQKQSLIKHAMIKYDKDGKSLINATVSLWEILRNAITDPQAGSVILVLDALDECANSEVDSLIQNIKRQLRANQSRHAKFKYLLTCRPYDQLVSKFYDLLKYFPSIRIPGEEESETISHEVNRVITHRVNQLSEKKDLSHDLKYHLEKRLKETTHRTYLWVYLVFDYLEREGFKKTKKGADSAIAALPRSISEAYEQILNKSNENPIVRKTLCIILAASRPLTLAEMNISVNIDNKSQSIKDLDLETKQHFCTRLRSSCGLFISIHNDNIYLLHQTAREFLLADPALPITIQPQLRWHRSITIEHAHAILAEVCVLYLNLDLCVGPPDEVGWEVSQSLNGEALFDYAATYWATHFRKGCFVDTSAIVSAALKICDPNLHEPWFDIFWEPPPFRPKDFTNLMMASYLGLEAVAALAFKNGLDIEARDSSLGRTSLSWAVIEGHGTVVKLLLENGADVNTKDTNSSRTPLWFAASKGHESICKLLVDSGASINAKDDGGRTPLLSAANEGHRAVVTLLVNDRANIEAKDDQGWTPLLRAAKKGHGDIVELLVRKGAIIEAIEEEGGGTALSWAACKGHTPIVELLLQHRADVKHVNIDRKTPLSLASAMGHAAIVELLLKNGSDTESKDVNGQSSLLCAVEKGDYATVQHLLDYGANIESKDDQDQTPLQLAQSKDETAIIALLLQELQKLYRQKRRRTIW